MAQPIRLIGDPDNQHLAKLSSDLYLKELLYVSFSRCRVLYIQIIFQLCFVMLLHIENI